MRNGPPSGGSFFFISRAILIGAGIFVALWQPSPAWIENQYANGVYPLWQHLISSLTLVLPFALGDLLAIIALTTIIIMVIRCFRARAWLRIALNLAMVLAIVVLWFDLSWGWNYNRAPLETRVAYQARRIDASALERLRRETMAHMNTLAPLAHAAHSHDFELATLHAVWLPVVQRLGDRWSPNVGAAKPTITGPFLAASGTGGFIDPFTLEVQLSPDELWFERPFDLAHEWTHVAAFAREDEANYVAALSCIRSKDPQIAYSGWFEIFMYLPPLAHYEKTAFVPQVWADFQAVRERNAKHINLTLSRFSWRTYNAYLKTNHIASGVANYNEVTSLLLAIPRDVDGLPVLKT